MGSAERQLQQKQRDQKLRKQLVLSKAVTGAQLEAAFDELRFRIETPPMINESPHVSDTKQIIPTFQFPLDIVESIGKSGVAAPIDDDSPAPKLHVEQQKAETEKMNEVDESTLTTSNIYAL